MHQIVEVDVFEEDESALSRKQMSSILKSPWHFNFKSGYTCE